MISRDGVAELACSTNDEQCDYEAGTKLHAVQGMLRTAKIAVQIAPANWHAVRPLRSVPRGRKRKDMFRLSDITVRSVQITVRSVPMILYGTKALLYVNMHNTRARMLLVERAGSDCTAATGSTLDPCSTCL